MRKRKEGFTLVELVIVIAVIAILAAVLVPTFANVIASSRLSNDKVLVRNINLSVIALEKQEGQPKTVTESINQLEKSDLSENEIKLKSKNLELIYDSSNNRYFIFDPTKDELVFYDQNFSPDLSTEVSRSKLWRITDKVETNSDVMKDFSIYLLEGYEGSTLFEITSGMDVGKNTNISKITYTSNINKGTYIRTNSLNTELVINAPADTVNHYGLLGTLTIIETATASYHENGKVANAEITKGRIVLEKGADVEHIHVNANEDKDGFETIIISKDESVTMPELSRDNIEIDEVNGTLVVAFQLGTEIITEQSNVNYIWLTKQGVYEQIKVSESSESAGSVWVDTSDKSQDTKDAARQIANNIKESNLTIAQVTYVVSVDPDTRDIVVTNEETGVVADENVSEAIISGIKDETSYYSSITEIEDEIFAQQNPGNNYVARIGMTGYTVLGATNGTTGALAQSIICSGEHKTVVLLKDISLGTSYIRIATGCDFTLDLNGHSIDCTGYQIFSKPGGNVTGTFNLINTSSNQAVLSVIRNGSSTYIFDLGGKKLTIGQLNEQGESINSNIKFIAKRVDGSTSNTPAVFGLGNNSNVIINGGEFDYPRQNLFTGGSSSTDTPVVINNGTFNGALFSGSHKPVIINGGTFNGAIDIVSSTCSVSITGGTFNDVVTVRGTDNSTAVLSIQGGIFNDNLNITSGDKNSTKQITGGTFSFNVNKKYSKYIPEEYDVVKSGDFYNVYSK